MDEKILQLIDSKWPCDKKTGPPLLPNLATRVDCYWKGESESEFACKYIKGEYTRKLPGTGGGQNK